MPEQNVNIPAKRPTKIKAGERMRAVRTKHNLTQIRFARSLGYSGKPESLETQIRRWECGYRVPPPWIQRLVIMYDAYGIPQEWRQ
jgi:transcriptional regulator with XRE-family HTH domain